MAAFFVTGNVGVVVSLGDFGGHGKRRRGVQGNAEAPVSALGQFGRQQAVEECEVLASARVDGRDDFLGESDVADSVLEAHHLRVGGEAGDGLGSEFSGAAVVHDHRKATRGGDGFDVRHHAIGGARYQVRREHQERVRAGFLGHLRGGDGVAQRTTCTGNYRHGSRNGLDGGSDHRADLIKGERMEFAGAAGRENAARAEGKTGGNVLLQQCHIYGAVFSEGSDGEEQYAVEVHGVSLVAPAGTRPAWISSLSAACSDAAVSGPS